MTDAEKLALWPLVSRLDFDSCALLRKGPRWVLEGRSAYVAAIVDPAGLSLEEAVEQAKSYDASVEAQRRLHAGTKR